MGNIIIQLYIADISEEAAPQTIEDIRAKLEGTATILNSTYSNDMTK